MRATTIITVFGIDKIEIFSYIGVNLIFPEVSFSTLCEFYPNILKILFNYCTPSFLYFELLYKIAFAKRVHISLEAKLTRVKFA